jgi:hypothetical protein
VTKVAPSKYSFTGQLLLQLLLNGRDVTFGFRPLEEGDDHA